MFFTHFYRISKFALQNLWRNLWLAIVTVTVIMLSLFSVNMVVAVNGVSQAAVTAIKARVDISVYLTSATADEQAVAMRQELSAWPEIQSVTVVTADQALARFQAAHETELTIQETLNELDENPLGPVLVVQAHDIDSYAQLAAKIQSGDRVDLIEEIDYRDRENLIAKINDISGKLTLGATALSIIFIVIAVLVIMNTVRLGIYSQREEIAIMKLVGASNFYTRAPFLFEGFIYALLSLVIFWLVMILLLSWLTPMVSTFLAGINFNMQQFFAANLPRLFIYQLLGLTALNFASAWLALGRYLKV